MCIFYQLDNIDDLISLAMVNKKCNSVFKILPFAKELAVYISDCYYPYSICDHKLFKSFDILYNYVINYNYDSDDIIHICWYILWKGMRYCKLIYPVTKTINRESSIYLYYGLTKDLSNNISKNNLLNNMIKYHHCNYLNKCTCGKSNIIGCFPNLYKCHCNQITQIYIEDLDNIDTYGGCSYNIIDVNRKCKNTHMYSLRWKPLPKQKPLSHII